MDYYDIDKNLFIDTPYNKIPNSKKFYCGNGIILQNMKKRPNKKAIKIFEEMAINLKYETSLDNAPTKCKNIYGFEEFVIYKASNDNKYYAIGGICIAKFGHRFEPQWGIQWVWIHPFYRMKGILKIVVDYLEQKYGELAIIDVISIEMECFAKKYNKKYNIMLGCKYYAYRKTILETVQNKII